MKKISAVLLLQFYNNDPLSHWSIKENNHDVFNLMKIKIIGDYQCGFRRNRSTTDHLLCIRKMLEKKWE